MDEPTKEPLPKAVVSQTAALVSGGLGLVAALAWNDAISSLFNQLFGTQRGGLWAKFLYAVLVTVIVVFVTVRLLRKPK